MKSMLLVRSLQRLLNTHEKHHQQLPMDCCWDLILTGRLKFRTVFLYPIILVTKMKRLRNWQVCRLVVFWTVWIDSQLSTCCFKHVIKPPCCVP